MPAQSLGQVTRSGGGLLGGARGEADSNKYRNVSVAQETTTIY